VGRSHKGSTPLFYKIESIEDHASNTLEFYRYEWESSFVDLFSNMMLPEEY